MDSTSDSNAAPSALRCSTPRTFFFDPDFRKSGMGKNAKHWCCVCQCGMNEAKIKWKVWSHAENGWMEAVHPEDVYEGCELLPVGNECRKKIPKEFLVSA